MSKKKKVAIFGSTGSIGTQSLEILKQHQDKFEVVFLSCDTNNELLEKQALEFGVLDFYSSKTKKNTSLGDFAKSLDYDIMINALVGIAGLYPTYNAVTRGKIVALANKESLVTGGDILIPLAKKTNAKIIPVDSEHSAIFQCLQGNSDNKIEKLILTASGGQFFGLSENDLEKVTLKDALNHPNWSMGKKITIDSSTLMNKGFEVIEAKYLFNVPPSKIEVVVHKESIIHSMIEFCDGAILAQLGVPDMKVPISYALSYPKRWETGTKKLDWFEIKNLSFAKPDLKTFKCLSLAYTALMKKNSYSVLLNALNEILVADFLEEKIEFLDIQRTLENSLNKHNDFEIKSIEDIINYDNEIRKNKNNFK